MIVGQLVVERVPSNSLAGCYDLLNTFSTHTILYANIVHDHSIHGTGNGIFNYICHENQPNLGNYTGPMGMVWLRYIYILYNTIYQAAYVNSKGSPRHTWSHGWRFLRNQNSGENHHRFGCIEPL